MRKFSKKALCLAAAGLVLAGGASVGSAYAYFTTYAEAAGGRLFELGGTRTEIEEQVENGVKIVSVKNTGDYGCYVRLTAFAGSGYTLVYTDGGSDKWTDGRDGYWYYSELLKPGERTKTMKVQIPKELLEDAKDTDLNVIVVQECAPESYDDAGELLPNGPERFAKTAGK